MHRGYEDIMARLGDPLWWDGQGVPRYDTFHPDLCGVYDTQVALVELACQGCTRRLVVAVEHDASLNIGHPNLVPTADDPGFCDQYGDPPTHAGPNGLCIGCSMTSGCYRILEFWQKSDYPDWMAWERKTEYEFNYGDLPFDGESIGGR